MSFEQEITKAIEHLDSKGCPYCGDINPYLDINAYDEGWEIQCVGCSETLYKIGTGWAKKMQGIVKEVAR